MAMIGLSWPAMRACCIHLNSPVLPKTLQITRRVLPLCMNTAEESLIYLSFPFVINFCKFVNKMNAKERKC